MKPGLGNFPRRPVPATLGVVFKQGRVLLVRRANPPDAGKWGFPGGKLEWGESITQGAAREVLEETGVSVRAGPVLTVLDCFDVREDGLLRQQFVMLAVLCEWICGDPVANDDALEARWFSENEWRQMDLVLSQDVAEVIRLALSSKFAAGAIQE